MKNFFAIIAVALLCFQSLTAQETLEEYLKLRKELGDDIYDIYPDFVDALNAASGWACTELCSAIFVSGVPEDQALREDVNIVRFITESTVDYEEKSVTSYLIGGTNRLKAIYREGTGCTLVDGRTEEELRAQDLGDITPLPALNETESWPLGDYVSGEIPDGIDMDCIQEISDDEFGTPGWNTRAFLVVYKGVIVHERYGRGFDMHSKLAGWSMTKSLTSAILGMQWDDGLFDLDDPLPVASWQGDERSNITYKNMLQMTSGIRYNEGMVPWCLFVSGGDCGKWYEERPKGRDPNTEYVYSTGITTLLSRVAMEQRRSPQLTNFEVFREELFRKLNMVDCLVESQAEGYPSGGSHGYCSARSWARFALLWMRGGLWVDGNRIVSEEYTEFACTPSDVKSSYGAHFSINDYEEGLGCSLAGFRDQRVLFSKEKDVLYVRLGMAGLLNAAGYSGRETATRVLSCVADK